MSFSLISQGFSFLLLFKDLFIYFWLCWVFVAVLRLSLAVASGGCSPRWATGSGAHGLSSCGSWALGHTGSAVVALGHLGIRAQQLWFTGFSSCGSRALEHGSAVVVSRLSCSVACGVFPDQGLNPHTMYWQVDSLPLDNQGSSPPPLFNVEV